MPRASIIITTHSRPALLQRSVESARRSGTGVEIVVVDDASADETRDVCRRMPDIRYVRVERQQAVAGARNIGILESSAPLLAFLDDDDVRQPGSIDRQVAVLDANPEFGLAYGRVDLAAQDFALQGRVHPGECPSGDVFWQLIGRDFIPTISVLFRRSAMIEAGGLNTDISPLEDWDLWVRIAELRPVAAVDGTVAIWREPTLWSGQGSSRVGLQILPQARRALETRWARLPRSRAHPAEFRRARRAFLGTFCDRLLWETIEAVRHRDPYALRSFARAVMLSPSAVLARFADRRYWTKAWSMLATTPRT